MSVAQAEEFYGPVLPVLEKKLGPKSGRENWETIVEFMAGQKPSECPPAERETPGTEKSIAIVYQGVDAVRKIRDVLGPTDPAKAPPGSIRREFGQTIMVNAAHASDSLENAKREMAIIQVDENNFKPLIEIILVNLDDRHFAFRVLQRIRCMRSVDHDSLAEFSAN